MFLLVILSYPNNKQTNIFFEELGNYPLNVIVGKNVL
jgi:hypothetical protein